MKNLTVLLLIALVTVTSCATPKRNVTRSHELTVLSYNIHHANPPSKPGFIDLDAIAKVIQESEADIIGLQEVDVMTNRNGQVHQAKALADKLGMYYHFFRAIDHDGGEYGLAILSKLPIKNPQTFRLPQVAKAEERILAMLQVQVGNTWIYFANTHLDASRTYENRVVQMQEILKITEKLDAPIVLCGDLNATPDSEPISLLDRAFTRTCIEDCAPTIPQINPRRTIDFIATRNFPWQQKSIEVIPESYASDHLPVKVVFDLKR